MKNLWVKEILKKGIAIIICLALLIIGLVVFILEDEAYTNKAIDQCVAGGQSYEVCESGLR